MEVGLDDVEPFCRANDLFEDWCEGFQVVYAAARIRILLR